MTKTREGDLLVLASQGSFDVIAHGCNCFCNMGKGIALQIKQQYPEAFRTDCKTQKGDASKLGTCSEATVMSPSGRTFTIVNAYTQVHWNGQGVLADYGAIRRCMAWLKQTHSGRRIGLPKIGAGLAGGDWPTIRAIIDEELAGEDVTVIEFVPR